MCEEVWFINVVHWSLMLMSARGDNMTARDCHSDPSTQILKDTQKQNKLGWNQELQTLKSWRYKYSCNTDSYTKSTYKFILPWQTMAEHLRWSATSAQVLSWSSLLQKTSEFVKNPLGKRFADKRKEIHMIPKINSSETGTNFQLGWITAHYCI